MRISNSTESRISATDATRTVLESIAAAALQRSWTRAGIGLLSGETTRKGIVTFADQAVASVTNFLTGVIIGRACTKEQFGLYMLGFSIILFVVNLQDGLISTPYMVYSPRLKGSMRAQYTGSTLIHQLTLSALVIPALAMVGVVLSLGVGLQDLAPVVWALVTLIMFILLRDYVRRICFANLRMKTALVLDSCVAFLQICGLLLLAYLELLSASRAYWVVGTACGIAASIWLLSNRKMFVVKIHQTIPDFRQSWSLGKWVLASTLLWALSMNFYPWILAAFHGTTATGVWAACLGIVAISKPILTGVQNFLGPKIAHTYATDGSIASSRYVWMSSAVYSFLITPVCIVLLFFGGVIVVWFYGDKYAGNSLLVSLLAVNLVVTAAAFPFSYALLAMGRADVDFAINFLALFILLTIGLWLVKSFGPLGTAGGLLVGNTAASAVRCVAFAILTRSPTGRQTK